jgi:hypothetical protein
MLAGYALIVQDQIAGLLPTKDVFPWREGIFLPFSTLQLIAQDTLWFLFLGDMGCLRSLGDGQSEWADGKTRIPRQFHPPTGR